MSDTEISKKCSLPVPDTKLRASSFGSKESKNKEPQRRNSLSHKQESKRRMSHVEWLESKNFKKIEPVDQMSPEERRFNEELKKLRSKYAVNEFHEKKNAIDEKNLSDKKKSALEQANLRRSSILERRQSILSKFKSMKVDG